MKKQADGEQLRVTTAAKVVSDAAIAAALALKTNDADMVSFVEKTTQAITIMAESQKQNTEILGGIKDMITTQNTTNAISLAKLDVKIDGLASTFKNVILPLMGVITAMVGAKLLFHL